MSYLKKNIISVIVLLIFISACLCYVCEKNKVHECAVDLSKYQSKNIENYEESVSIPLPSCCTFHSEFSQDEINLMARVVMSEASILSFEEKQAVAEVIINRLNSNYKEFAEQDCIADVILYPNAFSTADNGDPTEDCYRAIEAAITYNAFPDDLLWFRNGFVSYGYEYGINQNSDMKFSTINEY